MATTRKRKVTVETTGRTDLDTFFEKSGVLNERLTHYPLIAFLVEGDTVRVQVLDRASKVRELPPDTPIMAQWGGKWRSDFFHMTVRDVEEALAIADAEAARRERINPPY